VRTVTYIKKSLLAILGSGNHVDSVCYAITCVGLLLDPARKEIAQIVQKGEVKYIVS
jgi:hypothetical protein